MTKPFWVLSYLYRFEAEILTPCERSASCKSKWKLNGELESGALACKYRYLPERPRVFTALEG
jgi:hypothetical protein